MKHRLKINIKSTDLSTAHRLVPKPKTQGPDRRSIIIKLCRRELKHDLITACKKYKPPNFFINESLTPTRNSIFSHSVKLRKKNRIKLQPAQHTMARFTHGSSHRIQRTRQRETQRKLLVFRPMKLPHNKLFICPPFEHYSHYLMETRVVRSCMFANIISSTRYELLMNLIGTKLSLFIGQIDPFVCNSLFLIVLKVFCFLFIY